MSDYTAIAEVGETLIELLKVGMKDMPDVDPEEIVLFSPGEIDASDDIRLSLFLYQVLENVHLKNQEMQRIDSTKDKFPPLTLDLFYILTSHPLAQNNNRTNRTFDEHSILGKAMQIFHANPILTGSILSESLQNTDVELHLTLNPLSLDDLTKIWNTFQGKPLRPSVCYLVTPVEIDSSRPEVSVKRVTSKESKHYGMISEREEE